MVGSGSTSLPAAGQRETRIIKMEILSKLGKKGNENQKEEGEKKTEMDSLYIYSCSKKRIHPMSCRNMPPPMVRIPILDGNSTNVAHA